MSYSPSALCGPSRASISPERQVGAIFIWGNPRDEDAEFLEFTTITKIIRDVKNYKTAYFGKWGLGKFAGGPWSHGFDEFVGQLTHRDAHVVFPESIVQYRSDVNLPPQNEDDLAKLQVPLEGNVGKKWTEAKCARNPKTTCVYVNDIVQNETLTFIADPKNQPFFVVWARYPHAGSYFESGANLSPVKRITPGRVGTLHHESVRGHASQIEMHLDGDMGMLLELLESNKGLDENTLGCVHIR